MQRALGSGDLRWIAQGRSARGREEDSRWLLTQIEALMKPALFYAGTGRARWL